MIRSLKRGGTLQSRYLEQGMTKHDLKEMRNLGAELGAAKAENDRLREALRWYEEKVAECRKIGSLGDNARQALDRDGGFRARDALSQQTEPTDAFTAVDMATAAAQGFRDGQAAVEQATAQDERTAFEAWVMQHNTAVREDYDDTDENAPEDIRLDRQGGVYIWANAEAAWFAWKARSALDTRPAQTEQQPVAVPEGWKLVPVQPTAEMLAAVTTSTFEPLRQEAMKMAREDYQAMLYAAPIAQTEPAPAQQPVGEMISNDGDIYWADRHPPMGTKLYAAPIAQTEQQPLFFINPLVIDELKGKRKPSPGGLTWSRTACGHWTFAVYAAPIAQTAQGAGDASA